MKIFTFCVKCSDEHSKDKSKPMRHVYGEYEDESIVRVECPLGHKTIMLVLCPRYQMHFELASYAIFDGYFREAISTITVSLERFYEFYIRIVCMKRGIDEAQFVTTWKNVSLSERQLGAFLFLYLLENNRACDFAPRKFVELCNDITHKGYFPTRKEAVEYGQMAQTFIIGIQDELEATSKDMLRKDRELRANALLEKYRSAGDICSTDMSLILNHFLRTTRLERTYEQHLEDKKKALFDYFKRKS